MNRKDAQNLPFCNLEHSELQNLNFNSLLRIKQECQKGCKDKMRNLESTIDGLNTSISFLRKENIDLKVLADIHEKKTTELDKNLDRLAEKHKKQLRTEAQKNVVKVKSLESKISQMKFQLQESSSKIASHWNDFIRTDKQLKLQKDNNTQLSEQVEKLQKEVLSIQKTQSNVPVGSYQKVFKKAARELKEAISEMCILFDYEFDQYFDNHRGTFNCQKCGSSEYHPRDNCPAEDITCECCHKTGHYTLLCKRMGQFLKTGP